MITRRSWRLLGSSEQQVLRQQWQRSGKCIRCFRTLMRQQAENETSPNGDDQSGKVAAPKRPLSKQQRAAMISEEVKKIQQDEPKEPSAAASHSDATAAETIPAPATLAEDALPVSESQGTSKEESASAALEVGKGVEPERAMEQDAGGLGPGQHGRATADPSDDNPFNQPLESTLDSAKLDRETLLYAGAGSATIAGGNFEGVIIDHIKAVVEPAKRDAPRDSKQVARRKKEGLLVRFDSKAEMTETTGKLASMPSSGQSGLVDRLVKGTYDQQTEELQRGLPSQPVLQHIAQQTMLNGTYYHTDSRKFLEKVAELLPAASATTTTQRQPQEQPQK